MDKKTKNKIIAAMRKLTFSYKPRSEAKNKQKVGPATFQCESCGIYIYEGTKSLEKLDPELVNNPNGLVCQKSHMDHKVPVLDPIIGWVSWDSYLERLFCEASNFQCLCKSCHDSKTYLEDQLRNKKKKS